jgi:hypothetical protein
MAARRHKKLKRKPILAPLALLRGYPVSLAADN